LVAVAVIGLAELVIEGPKPMLGLLALGTQSGWGLGIGDWGTGQLGTLCSVPPSFMHDREAHRINSSMRFKN